MKVTDLRRKLMAALAAGGLLAPSAVQCGQSQYEPAGESRFRKRDINTIGGIRSPKILDWTAGTKSGFAYSHDGSLTGIGGVMPDYANGGPLAGGGHFYFTANATPAPNPDITGPGQFSQDVDVSTGASGTLIATGTAAYKISAFFSSYLAQMATLATCTSTFATPRTYRLALLWCPITMSRRGRRTSAAV